MTYAGGSFRIVGAGRSLGLLELAAPMRQFDALAWIGAAQGTELNPAFPDGPHVVDGEWTRKRDGGDYDRAIRPSTMSDGSSIGYWSTARPVVESRQASVKP